jgi:hypothetical protein
MIDDVVRLMLLFYFNFQFSISKEGISLFLQNIMNEEDFQF